jgi:hypothetical protein
MWLIMLEEGSEMWDGGVDRGWGTGMWLMELDGGRSCR